MNQVVQHSIQGNILIAGCAEGAALVLEESLSFWGGFDPQTGKIIDTHHPQYGQAVGGRVLFIPASRGSAGTPGGIAESLRNGSGPCAIVLGTRDVNVGIGTLVANRLYDLQVPVIEFPLAQMERFSNGNRVSINYQGILTILV